jgi:hypothetical protein
MQGDVGAVSNLGFASNLLRVTDPRSDSASSFSGGNVRMRLTLTGAPFNLASRKIWDLSSANQETESRGEPWLK